MSFKEFNATEYYNVWEEFKKENKNKVINTWGSIDKFDEMIENMIVYLSNANKDMNAADKRYGKGASKFIGEALKFYSENNK